MEINHSQYKCKEIVHYRRNIFIFVAIMDLQKPNIVVIIVVYNGAKWLDKLITSILDSTVLVSIVIVDNASSDNSVAILKNFPEVTLINSITNLGFGKANNLALEFALKKQFDYYFLLNQDTWVFPNTIKNLVEIAEKNPNYGIVSPMHFSGDGITLDANFEMYWNKKTEINETVGEVPFVNAAAWLMPIKAIETVGFFETLFPHYGEDRNYVDRLHYHKMKVVIAKNASICHDRIITTNVDKIENQSKLTLLSTVLNVNYSLLGAYLLAFKSVFGLPKYFYKKIGLGKSMSLFYKLLFYFIHLKLQIVNINSKRSSYK